MSMIDMELVKRDWVACGEQRQEEEAEGSFRVVQWNTLADGNLLLVSQSVLGSTRLHGRSSLLD